MTIVMMIWNGFRGYNLHHASAVAKAVLRWVSRECKFIVLTDDAHLPIPKDWPLTLVPLPAPALALTTLHFSASDYPTNLPKLWIFSSEAQEILGQDRVLYLDADSLVMGDLAPLMDYSPDEPFIGMHLEGKLVTSMFCLRPGSMPSVWETFQGRGIRSINDGLCGATDQGWMRHMGLWKNSHWPSRDYGIYLLKELDGPGPISPLPSNARVVHPTGKMKPWHRRFLVRYPWAEEHYPCLRTQ